MGTLITEEELFELRTQELERLLREMEFEVWFDNFWHKVEQAKDEFWCEAKEAEDD